MHDTRSNSIIFAEEEANNYFLRNQHNKNRFIAERLLSLFPTEVLREFSVAEFGIGTGANLMLLSNYVQKVHGYDVANEAVSNFLGLSRGLGPDRAYAQRQNVCEEFMAPIAYDIIIYGWFVYYVSNTELDVVKRNLLANLTPGGYVFVNDFIVRKDLVKQDRHNSKLSVYKRNLPFWINHFSAFDLIDFRLFDTRHYFDYQNSCNSNNIDPELIKDDEQWIFTGLFRHRL